MKLWKKKKMFTYRTCQGFLLVSFSHDRSIMCARYAVCVREIKRIIIFKNALCENIASDKYSKAT